MGKSTISMDIFNSFLYVFSMFTRLGIQHVPDWGSKKAIGHPESPSEMAATFAKPQGQGMIPLGKCMLLWLAAHTQTNKIKYMDRMCIYIYYIHVMCVYIYIYVLLYVYKINSVYK